VLEQLYLQQGTGFAIVMIAFPLLERYLRQKAGLGTKNLPQGSLFYRQLFSLFPELKTQDKAFEFWQVYRNGLLHQVAFSTGTGRPRGELSGDWPHISINAAGDFRLNPVDFAKRIIHQIEADFVTFEGVGSVAPSLATVWAVPLDHTVAVVAATQATVTTSGVNLPTDYRAVQSAGHEVKSKKDGTPAI
jgi:hypothetical protein